MTDTASSLLSAKGVIFDVDGTLVDSVDFHAEAWQRTFQLGSSAKGEELEIYKKIAGIEDLIHAQTTSDDAEKSKPDPDIFTAALDRLSLPAEAVIVVGDSPWDTIAARKAGMQSIALLCGGFPDRDLREAGPVAVFKNPEALLGALQQG